MSRELCEKCGARRGKAIYYNGTYCFACQTTKIYKRLYNQNEKDLNNSLKELPLIIKLDFNNKQWLRKYHITEDLIYRHNIYNCNDGIAFYFNDFKSCWIRNTNILSSNKKFKWLFKGIKQPYYIQNNLTINKLFIVEDIISAIRLSEFGSVLALGGTKFTDEHMTYLHDFKGNKFYIWMDSDRAGIQASRKIIKRLQLSFNNVINIFTLADPKCYSNKEIIDTLKRINNV